MVDDDYRWMKPSPDERINTTVHALITKERTQKLDLLIHLLSNLNQSLVVCGPQGIGKTTLLSLLQQRNTESWRYCFISGNADLSFEVIQQQLAQATSDRLHKQVVLVIDNAGELVPGLISAIIHYAAANLVFRVIFSLTHDELQVKRGSDKAVDDCHIVEIPTLSEKQCGDFLQHLSTKPTLNLPFKAITENMIAHVYRETHGVPGRIIAELSGLPRTKPAGKFKWIVAGSVALAIATVLGVQWQIAEKTKVPAAIKPKAAAIEIALPKPEPQIIPTPPAQPSIQQQELAIPGLSESNVFAPSESKVIAANEANIFTPSKAKVPAFSEVKVPAPSEVEVPPKQSSAFIEKKIPSAPEAKIQLAPQLEKKPENKLSADTQVKTAERLWAKQDKLNQNKLNQAALSNTVKPEELSVASANNFTLQLIVLSKQASVNSLFKKYPSITSGIRTTKMTVNGQDKFILEYGSYPDAVSAHKARQSLPAEFHQAMIRKIR